MDEALLKRKFEAIGARLAFAAAPGRWAKPVTLDVRRGARGEYFEIRVRPDAAPVFEVISVDPALRHLLLLERDGEKKHKYLCGHDERHWFTAAIPEAARGVTSVRTAFEALQPPAVAELWSSRQSRRGERHQRHNGAFIRQGEWFFVPQPDFQVPEALVLRQEPLSRGSGSKPHRMEFCYRVGGGLVYVCTAHPAGLSESEYRNLIRLDRTNRNLGWRMMRRDALVYARGRIRHADHATIRLEGWHRVYINTEHQAEARSHVVFLD